MAISSTQTGLSQREDRAPYGIVLMLIAYFMFSCIDTSVKWLAIAGIPALQLAFMRYAAHFVISSLLVGKEINAIKEMSRNQLGWVAVRGSLIMLSTVLNFISLRYLPLTLTSTILFSAPIWVCVLSWPMLGERVGIWRWSAILLGFVGIMIAIRPFDETFHPAALLSVCAAFSFALYSILTRRLAGQVSTNVMQFFSGIVGAVVLAPIALMQWQNPQSLADWGIMLALGIFGWGGHQLLTTAHRFAPASTLSPYSYSFIVYLAIWSYFLFQHLPDRWTVTGALIITVAGMVIWFRERSHSA